MMNINIKQADKVIHNSLFYLCIVFVFVFMNNNIYSQQNTNSDTVKIRKIIIEHYDSLMVNEILYPDLKIIVGNVAFKHDSSYMFCDSALYNMSQQTFRAYGRIHVISPTENLQDTVHMWGDSLNYIGNEKLAMVRDNVILQKDSMTLYTDKLDYNTSTNIGNYFDGGTTINGKDTLISRLGYYYADKDEIYFKDSAKVINPKFTIHSDTLKHNTKTKISYFLGPTHIIPKDTTNSYLYSENGWYNHTTDIAQFNQNALMVHETSSLKGDSLRYDRNKRTGRAFNNVEARDSTQNALLLGNYGEYHEITETAILTNRAQFIKIGEKDSLFMHADTIMSVKDSLFTKTDSTRFKLIKAFHKVKIYKSDFQAKCDSLVHSLLDTSFSLYEKPVLWSGKSQITSDFMKAITKNSEMREIRMYNNALIASQSDSIRFDQIRGRNMVVFIDSSKLKRIEVREDGAAIYFVREKKDEKEVLTGVYKVTCIDMNIFMGEKQVEEIRFYKQPEGTLYPPLYLPPEDLIFDIFEWKDKHRPKKPSDIFIWHEDNFRDKGTGRKTIDLNAKMEEEENKEKEASPNRR